MHDQTGLIKLLPALAGDTSIRQQPARKIPLHDLAFLTEKASITGAPSWVRKRD
jgi:hypothetical protein